PDVAPARQEATAGRRAPADVPRSRRPYRRRMTQDRPTPPRTRTDGLGLSWAAIAGLAFLGVPRAALHGLDVVQEGTLLNARPRLRRAAAGAAAAPRRRPGAQIGQRAAGGGAPAGLRRGRAGGADPASVRPPGGGRALLRARCGHHPPVAVAAGIRGRPAAPG